MDIDLDLDIKINLDILQIHLKSSRHIQIQFKFILSRPKSNLDQVNLGSSPIHSHPYVLIELGNKISLIQSKLIRPLSHGINKKSIHHEFHSHNYKETNPLN